MSAAQLLRLGRHQAPVIERVELEVVDFRQTPEFLHLIQDPTVEGLGKVALLNQYPEVVKGKPTGRTHDQYTVELDDHKHSVLVTDAVAQYSETDFYFLCGLTQRPDKPGGGAYKIHTELSNLLPHMRIASFASTGIGDIGDRLSSPDQATIAAMAKQRLRLMKAISGDRRKVIGNLSMGTPITNGIVKEDLETGQKLGIIANLKIAPAEVAPELAFKQMLLRFPFLMLPDAGRELFDKKNISDPRRLVATARSLARLGLGWHDLHPLMVEISSLTDGVPLADIEQEVANYPTAVIAGANDPVAQCPMWVRFNEKYHHNTFLKLLPGKGHGIAVDSVAVAGGLARALFRLDPAA